MLAKSLKRDRKNLKKRNEYHCNCLAHLFAGVHQTWPMRLSFSVMELIFDLNMRFTLVLWDIDLLLTVQVCHLVVYFLQNNQVNYCLNYFVKDVYQWLQKKSLRAWYNEFFWQVNQNYFPTLYYPNNKISRANVKFTIFLHSALLQSMSYLLYW